MRAFWSYGLTGALGVLGVVGSCSAAFAQITPDTTLGGERSQLTREVMVRGAMGDRIDGGAIRGANLFHSFSNFNVNDGQRVYFSNPTGVENILGRVTGTDVSDIMGTLGVDGTANLFLLNPNGIIFGPNARLDIGGSFTASTGDSVTFPGGTRFSAGTPRDATVLSVNVPLGVQYGPTRPGLITNAGTLTVGRNLSLSGGDVASTGLLSAPLGELRVEGVAGDVQVRQAAAQTATFSASNNLILQESQLQTAGNMNLLAGNTVQIRDGAANPFVAYAGGNLTVQGNQNVDIFALNHPSSGLVSGRDMVLRSANPVGGDAHYWTGGNFRIEQLDSNLGNLFSPYDPVIRSSGDVSFGDYTGASLHVFAGGSVTAGNINITQGSGANEIQEIEREIFLSTPVDYSLINASRPRNHPASISINGGRVPTLDIRAGIDAVDTRSLTPEPFPGSDNSLIPPIPPRLDAPATSANISINSITVASGGQVFLTNQYSPNLSFEPGSIKVEPISGGSSIRVGGGSVIVDSRGDITLNGADVSSGISQVGNMLLLSGGTIRAQGPVRDDLQAIYSTGSTATDGGDITFSAAGDIITTVPITSDVSANPSGTNAGSISFFSNGSIRAGAPITSNNNNSSGGIGGDIILNARNDITTRDGRVRGGDGILRTDGVASFSLNGDSGNITLISREGGINTTQSTISSESQDGRAGNVFLRALLDIRVGSIEASSNDDVRPDPVNSSLNEITINSEQGSVFLDNSRLETSNVQEDGSGNLIRDNDGFSGVIRINAGDRVVIRNGSQISTDGFAGQIRINAPNTIRIINGSTLRATSATSDNPNSDADNFRSSIRVGEFEQGTQLVILDNANLTTTNSAIGGANRNPGFAGEILIEAVGQVAIRNGSEIKADGSAGNITVFSEGEIRISGNSELTAISNNSDLGDNGTFSAITVGTDNGRVVLNNATLSTTNEAVGVAGAPDSGYAGVISIGPEYIVPDNNPDTNDRSAYNIRNREVEIFGSTLESIGNSGYILITASDAVEIINSRINAQSTTTDEQRDLNDYFNTVVVASQGEVLLDGTTVITSNNTPQGIAGNLAINGDRRILIRNRSELESRGSQGELFIGSLPDSVLNNDAGLDFLEGFQNLDPAKASISNNSTLTVDNLTGVAGRLEIRADSFDLSESRITAITSNREGNNRISVVRIDVLGSLFQLYNNSTITAGAEQNGDGGNVDISVRDGFILADPYGNSDILANAVEGSGGDITMTTNAIFGLEERDSDTPLSDILAGSEFGDDGEIVLNTLGIDPSRNPGELPIETVDAASLVAEGCLGPNRAGVDDQGEFRRTGRGGLSRNPTDALSGETALPPLATLDSEITPSNVVVPPETTVELLVEAQQLRRNADGKVALVADRASATSSPILPPNICPPNPQSSPQ